MAPFPGHMGASWGPGHPLSCLSQVDTPVGCQPAHKGLWEIWVQPRRGAGDPRQPMHPHPHQCGEPRAPGERQQEPEGQAADFCLCEASRLQSAFLSGNMSEPPDRPVWGPG